VNLQSRSRLNFIAIFAIAAIFSSFTLWLVEESWIKYPLFVIEICVIIIIYLVLDNYAFNIKSNFPIKILSRYVISKLNIYADLVLVFSSFILVFLNIYPNIGGSSGSSGSGGLLSLPHLILAFLCVSFLSGFSILNIFKINRHLSKLEYVVISYIASFILSGFTMLALLSINEYTRSIVIPILFMSIGIISLLQRIKSNARRIYKLSSSSSSSSAATSGIDNDYSDGKNGDDNGIDSDYSGSGSRKSSGGGGGGGGGFVRPSSLCNNVDVLAISISIIFYIVFFCLVYPNFTLVPSNDIARHYNWAVVLSRTPDLYTGFNYLLFHSFEATFYVVSGLGQTISSFQTIQIVLNIFIPLAVYILAKRYLENVDKRIPAIATIFYSVLSNFAYLDFVRLKLLDNDGNILSMLGKTAEHTLNGTINFMQPFPWFVPESVSFVIFMVSFLLLRINNISRLKSISLFSGLILSMYLIHVTDAFVFVIVISFYSIMFGLHNKSLRINDALLSSVIGMISSFAFFYYISFLWKNPLMHNVINIVSYLPILLPAVTASISLIYLRCKKQLFKHKTFNIANFIKYIPSIKSEKLYTFLSIFLISVYLFSFLSWVFDNGLKTSLFEQLGISPWFIYPLMLGVVGLLAILGIRYLGDILPKSNHITILLFTIAFFFVLGRLISFINLNIFFTGYWEKRFIQYIFLPCCILAPIALINFREQLQIKFSLVKFKKPSIEMLSITVISLIVLSGFSSMVLQSYYWISISNNGSFKINDQEQQALKYLKRVLQKDTHAFVITPSHYSDDALNFATPAYRFSLPDAFTYSKYPALPLFALASHNLNHAYIYVNNILDFDVLNHARESWFTEHLYNTLPVVFSNKMITIYNATSSSFPLPNSKTVMAIPMERFDNSWLMTQDLLSHLKSNYTLMFYEDPNIFKSKNIILGIDPTIDNNYSELFTSHSIKKNWDAISGYWTYSSDGLDGVGIKNTPESIILSPVYSKNIASDISTSFKINRTDRNVSNYASIIYSWVNPDNFQFAGLNIWKNNTYLFFAKVANGNLSYFPPWPGKKIDSKFTPSSVYNMTLHLRENTMQELNLNNKSNIYQKGINELGRIGLSYHNLQNISFRYFKMNNLNEINSKELLAKYISYAKTGGNLVIYDTNGYGSIFYSLFNKTIPNYDHYHDTTVLFNGPFLKLTNNTLPNYSQYNDPTVLFNGPFLKLTNNTLPNYSQYNDPTVLFNGPFLKLTNNTDSSPYPKNYNINIMSGHKSNTIPLSINSTLTSNFNALLHNQSIYITKKSIGQGSITYVNIYPLITKLNSIPANIVNTDLGSKLFTVDKLEKINYNSPFIRNVFDKVVASFKDLNGSGDVKINTSSIIFPGNFQNTSLKIITDKNKNEYFDNISQLDIADYRSVLLSRPDTNISVADGKGLYSDIYLDKNLHLNNTHLSYKIDFQKEKNISNVKISGIANNKSFHIDDASKLYIDSNKPIHIYTKQPHIQIFGKTKITRLNSNLDYIKTGYLPSEDFSFIGNLSLSIYLSDVYSLANGFSINKPHVFLQHHANYDYFTGIMPTSFTFFDFLYLVPFLTAIIFIILFRKKIIDRILGK
jgi:hypothetical protein